MPAVNVREDGSLELPILVSSFGESQRLRGTSERQDRSPDYPDAAEPSTLDVLVSDGTGLVKSEILKPNRGSGGMITTRTPCVRGEARA